MELKAQEDKARAELAAKEQRIKQIEANLKAKELQAK